MLPNWRPFRFNILLIFALVSSLSSIGSVAGAASEAMPDNAVSLCQVVATPKAFENRVFLLRAVYKLAVHGAVLIGDESCPKAFVVWRKAGRYSESESATAVFSKVAQSDGKRSANVVMRGTLLVLAGGFECSATTYCSNLVFEVSDAVAAKLQE